MTFEERLDAILKKTAANKKAVAELMGIPYSTFLYKSKELERWNILEFTQLCDVMRLTEDEKDFLCGKVQSD